MEQKIHKCTQKETHRNLQVVDIAVSGTITGESYLPRFSSFALVFPTFNKTAKEPPFDNDQRPTFTPLYFDLFYELSSFLIPDTVIFTNASINFHQLRGNFSTTGKQRRRKKTTHPINFLSFRERKRYSNVHVFQMDISIIYSQPSLYVPGLSSENKFVSICYPRTSNDQRIFNQIFEFEIRPRN